MNKKVFISKELKIAIPEHWKATIDDDVFSTYDPENGVGALQFSVFIVPDPLSLVLKDELIDLVDGELGDIIEHENSVQSTLHNKEQNKNFKYWLVRDGKNLIFGTYNCDEADKEIEGRIVEEIVRSIQREKGI